MLSGIKGIVKALDEMGLKFEKDKYENILKNFREIDWGSDKFYINIGEISFKFVLKK